MRMMMIAALLAAAASPAVAGERTGYMSIAAGNLERAERTLESARRADPNRPEVLLNLAAVYGQTGRTDAARGLYREVLAGDPIRVDMPSGATVTSHEVAQRGLAKLGPAQFATR